MERFWDWLAVPLFWTVMAILGVREFVSLNWRRFRSKPSVELEL